MATAWAKEQEECKKKINEYKLAAEANCVASLFAKPELIYNAELNINDFSNNIWKCWYAVADGLILRENKQVLDELTVGIYLDKHLKLKNKLNEYGGYSVIQDATTYINTDNFDGYVEEIKKWNTVLQLLNYGFPVSENLSKYADKSVDVVYNDLESMLNAVFLNTEIGVQSFNAFANMDEYIQSLNDCEEVGMPLYGSTLLNDAVAGIHKGNIMGIGAASGVGKSWLAFNYIVPSAIQYGERVVAIVNEESERRWKMELLIFVVNHVFNHELHKYQIRNGNFNSKIMEWLKEASEWIQDKANEHLLTIVPLQSYNVDLAIKIIKKYKRGYGCGIFILDTLKESNNAKSDDTFKSLTRDTVKLYDTIKPTGENVALILTYQLNKQSLKVRHLTNQEIGMAKSIIDVFSSNILVRRPNSDEYGGESKQIDCFRIDGDAKIPFTLDRDKNYLIIFLSKNRWGVTDPYQIVAEINQSTNQYEEVGVCYVKEDW